MQQRFIDVVTAYEVLSDADSRRHYDLHGAQVGVACANFAGPGAHARAMWRL